MKKRFKNILIKSNRKSGVSLFIGTAVLTLCLGSLTGCSIAKSLTENAQASTGSQNAAAKQTDADEPFEQLNVQTKDLPDNGNQKTLTVSVEGENEEMAAELFDGDGFSIYIPEGWKQYAPDAWHDAENEQVQIWVAKFEGKTLKQAEKQLSGDGYESYGIEMQKQKGDVLYRVSFTECKEDVWGVFYCYPLEAEEGWGSRLSAFVDTFAAADVVTMLAYIKDFDGSSISFDAVEWVTVPSERASELGIADKYMDAGFYVHNEEKSLEQLPITQDCSCTVLNWTASYEPMEVAAEKLASILKERKGTKIPYHLSIQDHEIFKIQEQYIP